MRKMEPLTPEQKANWKKVRLAVFERDFRRCQARLPDTERILPDGRKILVPGRPCLRGPPQIQIQCAHIIPRSKGGPDTVANCVTKCLDCHGREHPWMFRIQKGTAKNMTEPLHYRAIKATLKRAMARFA